jgi:hypothetical protein
MSPSCVRARFPQIFPAHKAREYNLTPEEKDRSIVFGLPTTRNAYVPILQKKEGYQMVGLRGSGLKELKKGEYQINIHQEDLEGRTQGGINLVIRINSE